ncbi:MAG: putative maltokinase [Nitrospiraceae bacterium]
MITVNGNWEQIFEGQAASRIEELLPPFLTSSRWFGGKARRIHSAKMREVVPIDADSIGFMLLLVDIRYVAGGADTYAIPITAAFGPASERIKRECPQAVIGELQMVGPDGQNTGVLYDALWSEDQAYVILLGIGSAARFRGMQGTVAGSPTEAFEAALIQPPLARAEIMKGEQSNTSIRFGDKAIVKVYRRLEKGVNPDLEIGRVLTTRDFAHAPAVLGALEYVQEQQEPMTLAIAQQFVPNTGDGWRYTIHELEQYFARIVAMRGESPSQPGHPAAHNDLLGHYGGAAARLGQRTAELHSTLAQSTDDQAFAPEACSLEYLQVRSEAMIGLVERTLTLLRENVARLPDVDRSAAQQVLEMESAIGSRMRRLLTVEPTTLRIRCHGDYHLGQVLHTDGDFVIIDFEGEPARPLAERRAKHLPILDLAGMIRSFHYAAFVALRERIAQDGVQQGNDLEPWARIWYRSARGAFIQSYMQHTSVASFQPRSRGEFTLLLNVHLLEKAVYELGYELNNRPAWVAIPLHGILEEMRNDDCKMQDGSLTVGDVMIG